MSLNPSPLTFSGEIVRIECLLDVSGMKMMGMTMRTTTIKEITMMG